MNFRPTTNHILISKQDRANYLDMPRGTVVATGPKCFNINIGDKIAYVVQKEHNILIDGIDYVLIKNDDVYGVENDKY